MVQEMYPYLMDSLFEGGALDVFLTPVMMKKNRPGTLVSVLCGKNNTARMEQILFSQSTTIGLRKYGVERRTVQRREKIIRSEFGEIKVKLVKTGSRWLIRPEYEVCRRIARDKGLSLPEVYRRIEAMNIEW